MTHPTSGDSSQGQPLFEEAAGETLRAQTSFDENLSHRANDSSYTFRQRLQQIDGAIEE